MTFLIAFFCLICFCFISVTPRSIQSDEIINTLELQTQSVTASKPDGITVENLESITEAKPESITEAKLESITEAKPENIEVTNTVNIAAAKPESINNVVWTKLEPIPQENIPNQEENTSGIEEEPSPKQQDFSKEINIKLPEEVETTMNLGEKLLLDTEPPLSSMDEKVTFEFSDNNQNNEVETEEIVGELSKNSSNTVSELLLHRFEFGNISSSILNFSGNAIGFELLPKISSSITPTVNETDLMSEGSETSPFQEVTTVGFEFLIESETTQSFLLTELLSSESFLLSDDDQVSNESTEEVSFLDTTNFTLLQDIESGIRNVLTDIGEAVQFVESFTFQESETENTENKSENVTEIIQIETKAPKCPEPGWCVLWFLAQDTCAENNDCLGSRICCKSGCSKTCLDVQS